MNIGRVTTKTQTVGSLTKSVGYAYTNGDLTQLVTPSGQTITYGYANHQVTSIAVNGTTLLSGVLYEPFGPLSGWTWANGTNEARVYDEDGNLTSLESAEAFSYSYDNAFRITAITDNDNGALSQTYGYDLLDRLTGAVSSVFNENWTYDANGNRLSQTGTAWSTYAISPTSNQISAISGTLTRAYSYDAAGHTTSFGPGTTATYNGRGRLSTVSYATSSESFTYDALGRLVLATGSLLGTELAVYDETGHLLGEYDGSGNLIQETVWMGDVPVATLRPNGSGGINLYYVHTDHLKAPRRVTRPSDNKIVWRWDSDPFGNASPNANPSGLGTFTYNLRFPGQILYANGAREYDPTTGRYVESDPIGLRGGINTYAYVSGSPISNYDPTGLCKVELRFAPAALVGWAGIYHAYVVTTDPNGRSQTVFRGGPGSPNVNGIFGNIRAQYAPYGPKGPDWTTKKPPSMLIYQDSESCGCENQSFKSILNTIDEEQLSYFPAQK